MTIGLPHRRHEGRLHPAAVDTPQNLYDYPANLFVAGFIGTPQMNIFTLPRSKSAATGVYAVFGDNTIKVPEGQGCRRS